MPTLTTVAEWTVTRTGTTGHWLTA